MKIIKTASGQYRLSHKSWTKIGQESGWLNEEVEDVIGTSLDEYENFETPITPLPGKILLNYSTSQILAAIKRLGEESIAGFLSVKEYEVQEVLANAEPYELQEIWDNLKSIHGEAGEMIPEEKTLATQKNKITKQAMGLEGQIQSYVKKIQTKAGKELFVVVLYGNTKPISGYLGKPKRGQKEQTQDKLFFNYFQGTWSRIIPEAFVEEILTGKPSDDPVALKKMEGFKKAITALQQGFDVDGTIYKADLSSLFNTSSYGDIEINQQSQISGKQQEIKNETMKAGTAPKKLEALDMFINAEIKRISEMTDKAAQSSFVKSFLSFSSKFYNYSFGNQLLIWIQKPNSTMVSGIKDWQKKFGREVVDFGDPITVRVPMWLKRKDVSGGDIQKWKQQGESDSDIFNKSHHMAFGTGSVYDISATKAIPGWTDKDGNPPYEPIEWRQDNNESVEEIEVLVNAAIRWAENNSINVGFEEMSGSLGGYSSGGSIKINDKYDGINKFSTLVHECSHEVLHWEQGKGKNVRNTMGKTEGRMAKEIDAETTAFIVLEHYGFETVDTPNYLALWKAGSEDVKARRQNISESVRVIIKGMDGEVRSLEMAEENIDKLMEENVDEHGIDMEKKKIEEEPEEIIETVEPTVEPIVEETMEEMIASKEDTFLKIAQKFKAADITILKGNFLGSLGLDDTV